MNGTSDIFEQWIIKNVLNSIYQIDIYELTNTIHSLCA